MAERHRADVLVSCLHGRSPELIPAWEGEIERRGLAGEVKVVETGCRGFCAMGPVLVIQPDGVFYVSVHPEDVPEMVEETLIKGRVVKRLTYREPATRRSIPNYAAIPFYGKQMRVVLRNCGLINPQSIEEYIAVGGYEALGKVLTSMTPPKVIEEINKSGLRGRGGAGFPTGRKWEATRKAKGDVKCVIANGDAGDPGAFTDRALMEGDPHALLEGMMIGAYAIGAHQGYIHVRDDYPLAMKNLGIAIDGARELGLLGQDILSSGFDFDVKLVRAAGDFVCAEPSTLIRSPEAKVGKPRPEHFHATNRGLWERLSCLNNVETWANVPHIINKGADWFASIGTEGSKGTKIFRLVGKIRNTGLIEVPMGTTLREIVYDIGGGPPRRREFKAIQTGGPWGGCIPVSLLDLPVDYERLSEAGSTMGTGRLIVMDDRTCMVDIARQSLKFLRKQSWGECTVCSQGMQRMLEILTAIAEGRGKEEHIDLLSTLARTVQNVCRCGLGKTATGAVLSTLRHFRDEYKAHIVDESCPAGVCKDLTAYYILADKCPGCGTCIGSCRQHAITAASREPPVIDQAVCIRCGACFDACQLDAIIIKSRTEMVQAEVA